MRRSILDEEPVWLLENWDDVVIAGEKCFRGNQINCCATTSQRVQRETFEPRMLWKFLGYYRFDVDLRTQVRVPRMS